MNVPKDFPAKGSPHADFVAYWKATVEAELAEAQARHARVCGGLDGPLLRVAQFHHPIPGNKEVYCNGCDHNWENAILAWPCPTWELIEA